MSVDIHTIGRSDSDAYRCFQPGRAAGNLP